jgi:hypothetical protein
MIGGYLDARDKTLYKRALAAKPPPGDLTQDWREYFDVSVAN